MNPTKERILSVLYEENQPMSIGEIGEKIGVSWATAKSNVLELSQDNLLKVKKVKKNWIVWKDETNKPFKTCDTYRRNK